jgi:hypothetical protein
MYINSVCQTLRYVRHALGTRSTATAHCQPVLRSPRRAACAVLAHDRAPRRRVGRRRAAAERHAAHVRALVRGARFQPPPPSSQLGQHGPPRRSRRTVARACVWPIGAAEPRDRPAPQRAVAGGARAVRDDAHDRAVRDVRAQLLAGEASLAAMLTDAVRVAVWETMPSGRPCRVGDHAGWETMPSGIPCRMR